MSFLDELKQMSQDFAPFLAVVALVIVSLTLINWLLLRKDLALDQNRKLPRQLILLVLILVGLVIIILSLPVEDDTQSQLLKLLGLLASGIIALSSTTLVTNAMAGIMLRSTKSFRTGDFIRINHDFGRVTERGWFHTEIQTEDRELTTLPNQYLISNPVTVVRSSGTLVSVSLSLGYDVHHSQIEPLLMQAARQVELEEPFVRVMELGNFSVTYRVSGFLEDIKNLLTVRSNLCRSVLDQLHDNGIEIVSPAYMAQRPIPAETRVIPHRVDQSQENHENYAPEDLMFDKAERAEKIEGKRIEIVESIRQIEDQIKSTKGDERKQLDQKLKDKKDQLKKLDKALEGLSGKESS